MLNVFEQNYYDFKDFLFFLIVIVVNDIGCFGSEFCCKKRDTSLMCCMTDVHLLAFRSLRRTQVWLFLTVLGLLLLFLCRWLTFLLYLQTHFYLMVIDSSEALSIYLFVVFYFWLLYVIILYFLRFFFLFYYLLYCHFAATNLIWFPTTTFVVQTLLFVKSYINKVTLVHMKIINLNYTWLA